MTLRPRPCESSVTQCREKADAGFVTDDSRRNPAENRCWFRHGRFTTAPDRNRRRWFRHGRFTRESDGAYDATVISLPGGGSAGSSNSGVDPWRWWAADSEGDQTAVLTVDEPSFMAVLAIAAGDEIDPADTECNIGIDG